LQLASEILFKSSFFDSFSCFLVLFLPFLLSAKPYHCEVREITDLDFNARYFSPLSTHAYGVFCTSPIQQGSAKQAPSPFFDFHSSLLCSVAFFRLFFWSYSFMRFLHFFSLSSSLFPPFSSCFAFCSCFAFALLLLLAILSVSSSSVAFFPLFLFLFFFLRYQSSSHRRAHKGTLHAQQESPQSDHKSSKQKSRRQRVRREEDRITQKRKPVRRGRRRRTQDEAMMIKKREDSKGNIDHRRGRRKSINCRKLSLAAHFTFMLSKSLLHGSFISPAL
jgi:hypothetical protein